MRILPVVVMTNILLAKSIEFRVAGSRKGFQTNLSPIPEALPLGTVLDDDIAAYLGF